MPPPRLAVFGEAGLPNAMNKLSEGLLKKTKLFILSFLIFSFLFTTLTSPIYATHDQTPSHLQSTNNRPYQTQGAATTSAQAQTNPSVPPTSQTPTNPELERGQVARVCDTPIIGGVCDTADIVGFLSGAVAKAVRKAFTALMDFIFQILSGQSFANIAQLHDKAYAYKIGADISEIKNPGLLDFAGIITSESLELNVPINSTQYFASINPFSKARAAGADELAGSSVLLDVWTRVRNVAYALSAVVLIVVGFMIMLRWRLDPRTVVTVQNSLPRVVISLILITFSFAIAGLLIDITRVITDVVMSLVAVPGASIAGFFIAIVSAGVIGGLLSIWAGPLAFIPLVIGLILAIIVFIVFIVLIYKILTRYVIFLLLTIFSPLFFLGGALPGGEGLVLNWFKRQAAALLAIPMVALFVNLSVAIGFSNFEYNSPTDLTGGFPSPWPVIGGFATTIGITLLPPLIGLGIFFFATKVPDIVDEMMGIKELGARKGIGPGAILGAPLAAASTLGTVGRAAPTIAGLSVSRAGTGGPRGWLATLAYKASQPLSGERYRPFSQLMADRKKDTESTGARVKQSDFAEQAARARAEAEGVSPGPPRRTAGGSQPLYPDRSEMDDT